MIELPYFNITVGPVEEAQTNSHLYTHFINVDDCPGPQFGKPNAFWYPINELSNWGFGPFYWSKKILDEFQKSENKILLHCAAGVCRSPAILVAWLYSRGYYSFEINNMIKDDWYTKKFKELQTSQCIPTGLNAMYRAMQDYPSYSLMGVLNMIDKRMNH